MLRLTTFSTVDLADGGGEGFQALLKQPKRLGLLVYLAVEGPRSLHRRDSLLPIFWPELDEQRARHALSQALHVLRAAVGNGLIVTRGDEEVGIDPEALWCDATEFEALVGEGKFEEGLELLRGEFLPGFHLSDAPQFMEWVDAQRGNFRRKASLAAKGLCDQEKDRGRLEAAVSWARRGMEISPHDEAWLRRLVRLLDGLGRRAEAVAAFDSFATMLERDLELEPSPESQVLVEEIRNRQTGAAPTFAEGRKAPVPSIPHAVEADAAARDKSEEPSAQSPFSFRSTFGRALVRTAASILLVILVVVGGRYWYLSNRYFLKIGFQELVGVSLPTYLDSNREQKVYLMQGLPVGNWLDARIGFPRVVREAEVKMDWLRPDEVPILEAGLPVRRGEEEDGFLPLIFPESRVEWLIATGRIDEGLAEVMEMFAEAGPAGDPDLDLLVTQLAYAGVSEPNLLATPLSHGLRVYRIDRLQYFQSGDEAVTATLRLLENFPAEEQGAALAPWLADPGRAGLDALWIAAKLQLPEVRSLAHERLNSPELLHRRYGFGALLTMGDCEDMAPLAQAVSAEPGITLNQISEFVLFAARCRASPSVLMPLVDDEEMAVRGDVALGLLGLDSRRPLPAVKQLLGPTPNVAWRSGTSRLPEEWYRLRGLIGAPESDAIPILLPYLQNPDANVRALVASFLAHWGRGEAVEPLLETVLDPSITSTVRMHVVEALRWFSGDRIVAALDSILASEDLSSFHPYAYVGFAWTDPAVAIPRLLKGLEDPRARGEASMVFLTLDPTQAIPLLEAELDQLPEASQIEVVEALQRLGQKQYPELLREYMESGEKDGSMYPIASRALEHAYSHSPVTVALDALSSPVRDVRDIAIYGLSGHLSRNEVLDSLLSIIADPRDERQVRARLALWATRVAARQDALLDRGEEALVRGDVPRARAFFDRGGSEGMIGSVVMRRGTGRGLTPTSPHYSLRRVLMREFPYWAGWPGWRQRTLWNQYRAILSTGIPAPPLSEFFSYHFPYMVRELIMGPSWKAELRNDPILEPLREFYAFRVAIGLQEPIEVEMGPDGSFEMRSH